MNNSILPYQTSFYQGKVRDVYTIADKFIVMLSSNRLSAFDVILPCRIPYKGQVLNQLAGYMLNKCRDIVPVWLLKMPCPSASIGLKCEPFKIEVVVRGNLTGHAWREYSSGNRYLCGNKLPENMFENQFFQNPIITPTTKASAGHDEDISPEEIIKHGLATEDEWQNISNYAIQLFKRGNEIAGARGLILADTKYEFGMYDGTIMLMDEIHTPDSSRYFFKEGFNEIITKGEKPEQLSKEFVREWLIQNNFMGKPGQIIPEFSENFIIEISEKYISLYEKLTGEKFIKSEIDENEMFKILSASITDLIETN